MEFKNICTLEIHADKSATLDWSCGVNYLIQCIIRLIYVSDTKLREVSKWLSTVSLQQKYKLNEVQKNGVLQLMYLITIYKGIRSQNLKVAIKKQ